MSHMIPCIAPPPLTDVELSMYLDGEAEPHVGQHVDRCAACHARAAELARQHNAWAAPLYRSICPASEELRDYQMGFLTRAHSSNVGLHLARCPHCTREIFALDEFLDEAVPAANLAQQAKRLVAKLTAGLSAGSHATTALAGQRGGEEQMQIYQAGDLQIGLEVEENVENGRKNLNGLITSGALDNLLVHLWQGSQLVATVQVDGVLGDFQFTNIAPANYELIISAPQTLLRIPQIIVAQNPSSP